MRFYYASKVVKCCYYLKSDFALQRIKAVATGSVRDNLKLKMLYEFPINIPELSSQKNIVELLDKIKKIEGLKKAELDYFDTLVKARFVEMFRDIPVDITLSDACRIITDGTHQSPKFKNKGIPFLFVSNIADNRLTYNTEKFIDEDTYNELIKRTPIEVGDVLLSTVGSYGHPAVVEDRRKFLFQRHIAYLKPDYEKIDSYYLYALLLTDLVQYQIDRHVKGIAQKTLNLKEIKNLKIPLPTIEEQRIFTAFFRETNKSKVAINRCTVIIGKALQSEYHHVWGD